MVATRQVQPGQTAHKAGGFSGNLVHRAGGAIKAVTAKGDSGWVEGYLVSWGNPQDTDLQGEHFTPRTEFCLDWFKDRPVLYHHGLDGQAGLRKIGSIKTVEQDDLGLWVQAQLDLRDRYANAVYDMVKSKEFGWSSGSVDHLVKIATNGEIAVWPLIEGSITPTPAQPSKTSVRAFKAILTGDDTLGEYLRGLEARVSEADFVPSTKSSLYVPSEPRSYSLGSSRKASGGNDGDARGESSMARKSSKRLARAFANAFGIKTDDQELTSVAAEVETQVDEEVAQAAAEEMEMEAALAALEQEMVGEEKIMARSLRSRRAPVQNRRASRSAYRADDQLAVEADDIAVELEDEIAAQMDDIATEMAEEIAAEMEQELATQSEDTAMEKNAARAIRRSAWRRALRQLTATDDIDASLPGDPGTDIGGDGDTGVYLGEESFDSPPVENFKSSRRRLAQRKVAGRGAARRGYARRDGEFDPATVQADPEIAVESEDDAMLLEEVAAQAYRNGFRKGIRRGMRTTDAEVPADVMIDGSPATAADEEVAETVASLRRGRRSATARRANARRGYARRDGEIPGDVPPPAALADEEALQAAEDEAVAQGDTAAAASIRRLRRAARRGYAYREGELPVDDAPAAAADPEAEEAAKAFRRGYRAAMRRAMRNADVADPNAVQGDEEALMGDFVDDQGGAVMGDEEVMEKSYRSRTRATGRNFRGKSGASGYDAYDYNKQSDYWRNRAMKAEQMEAGSQRSFGNTRVVRDQADQPGAYTRAFKSYLYQGLGLMGESDKQVLKGKGQVNWGSGSFGMKAGSDQIISGRAMKTYFGGSDASVGFAVPPDWVAELNKNVMTQTVMAPECRTRTTTSDRIVQPNLVTTDARRAHAAVVRWPGEVITDPTESRTIEDQYSQVDVPIHVMLISLTAGNSALEDVTFSLEDEINEAFSEAVAVAYDELIWAGDGQGKLEGIVVNDQVVGARSTGIASVSGYVPSGSPDGIVTADVIKELLFHLPRGYRQRAKWYMNTNTALQISTLKDGEGNYLIDQRDESLQAGGIPDRLLGKPIVYNDYADDIAEDSFPIVYGDLSRGYIIGKRVDFSIRRFDDSAFAQLDQVLFLGRARLGGQVLQPAALKVLKIAAS